MNINGEFEEIIRYIDEWRKGEYGLIITDIYFNNTLELVDLSLKGEYRVSCEDLFINTTVFQKFYEIMWSAYINYGKDSALFEETVRVVREQLVKKFYDGLDIVNDEMTTVVDIFKKDLLAMLREVELGSNIIVVLNFNTVIPVLVDDDVEILSGLVN